MIYLLGLVFLLQSLFWLFLEPPITYIESFFELKFFNLFLIVFLFWIISGEAEKI